MTTQVIDEHPPHGLTRAELMTAREVAELFSVPISTVREWGRTGTLPRVKLGRHVRYIRRHVEAAISTQNSLAGRTGCKLVQHPTGEPPNRPSSTKAPWREGASV